MFLLISTTLLTFAVALNAVPQWLQIPHRSRCPKLARGTVGICIEECGPIGSTCIDGRVCCSNGCGHVCTDPVEPAGCNGSRKQPTGPAGHIHPCAAVLCKPCTVCKTTKAGKAICIPSHGKGCCKEGIVNCLVDPCQVTTCPAHSDATCVSNYCGGCNAEFYDSHGHLISDCNAVNPCAVVLCEVCSVCQASKSGRAICVPSHDKNCCKEGIVNCFVDPCQFATCPAHPGATCVSNYCGGCNAEFYDEQGHLLKDCAITDPIPIDPCAAVRCKSCTVCVANKDNRALCLDSPSACCEGPFASCKADPCEIAKCPAHPNAICVANYCGTCSAAFFDQNGKPIADCSRIR